MSFLQPPRLYNDQGQLRTVGFELEFGGVALEESTEILREVYGGEITRESTYVYSLKSVTGTFKIEADSTFLKEKRFERYLTALGLRARGTKFASGVEDAISHLAGTLIPFEIVMPPMKITELDSVELVRDRLQRHSATGTNSSLFTAFGMQFNPELPDYSAPTILGYLRAFFLMFDWLYAESRIPVSRKLAPFIHNFPKAYVRLVLDPSYLPDRDRLITDYLEHNPTRNRPLDMLPLFSYLDHTRVFSYPIEHALVKSRPTFHYRLPNSQVDAPEWTIASDWNLWIEVERLAGDVDRIQSMTSEYLRTVDRSWIFGTRRWIEKTRGYVRG